MFLPWAPLTQEVRTIVAPSPGLVLCRELRQSVHGQRVGLVPLDVGPRGGAVEDVVTGDDDQMCAVAPCRFGDVTRPETRSPRRRDRGPARTRPRS